MSQLIIEIYGSKIFNRTIWVPVIKVFDDYVLYKKRNFFKVKEISIYYKQISQVKLHTGLFFADLEIGLVGNDTSSIRVRFAPKDKAKKTQRIIDQKVHLTLAHSQDLSLKNSIKITEKSIARLQELLNKQKISKKEFNQKKKDILDLY